MKPFTLLLLGAIQALTVFSYSFPFGFLTGIKDHFNQIISPHSATSLAKESDLLITMLQGLSHTDRDRLVLTISSSSEYQDGKSGSDPKGQNQQQGYKFFMKWDDLPETIKQYIRDHPYETAFHVVNGGVFIAPGMVWGPVLGLLGFTGLGPAAGSAASFAQSLIHPVVSKGVFAVFQSAKMGGYGVKIMDIAVRTGMGVFSGGSWFARRFEGDDSGEGESEGKGEQAGEGQAEGYKGRKTDGGKKGATSVSRVNL